MLMHTNTHTDPSQTPGDAASVVEGAKTSTAKAAAAVKEDGNVGDEKGKGGGGGGGVHLHQMKRAPKKKAAAAMPVSELDMAMLAQSGHDPYDVTDNGTPGSSAGVYDRRATATSLFARYSMMQHSALRSTLSSLLSTHWHVCMAALLHPHAQAHDESSRCHLPSSPLAAEAA